MLQNDDFPVSSTELLLYFWKKKNLLGFQLIVLKDSLILPCRIWLRVKFCHLLGGVCHNLRFPPWKEGDPVIRKTLKVKITSYSPVEKFQINTFCFPGALAFHFKHSQFQGTFLGCKGFLNRTVYKVLYLSNISIGWLQWHLLIIYIFNLFIRTIFGTAKSRLKWSTTYWEARLQHHRSKK